MVANDVDSIVNMSHSVDVFENTFQELFEIKRWNTSIHGEYITAAIKLQPIATTAKMGVALKRLSRSKDRVSPSCRLRRLSLFY